MKKTFWFCLFFLGGILVGTVLSAVARDVSWLHWLCWGDSIGIGVPNPVSIDLSVIRMEFGFSLELDVARLLGIIGGLALYYRIGRKL